jgi:threonine/homoserine/homoserine lactone efflux protein
MDPWVLLKGAAVGFVITTPAGPVGFLCIRRTLTQGPLVGFVSGLGASAADAVYAVVAAVGVSFAAEFLVREQFWIRLGAACLLLLLGSRVFLSRPSPAPDVPLVVGLTRDFGSIFLLAMSNPMVVISMGAIFAALGLTSRELDRVGLAALSASVFAGSAAWWVIVAVAAGLLKVRFGEPSIRWINRVTGAVIAGFGLLVLLSLGIWRGR